MSGVNPGVVTALDCPAAFLRAEQEMVSVCSFGDWNPSHFLDVGEMTMAVAIGYDWLFDKLSPETRRVVRESILQKGFAPSNDKQYNWFLKAENNWNQVCNTGLVYGALALLDSDSKEAAAVIERAMSSVPLSMKCTRLTATIRKGIIIGDMGRVSM